LNCGSKHFEDLTTENTELHRDKNEEGASLCISVCSAVKSY